MTPGTITPAEPPFPGGSTTYQPGGQPQMGQQLMLAPAPDDFGDSGTATTGWSLAAGIAGVALSATILGFGLGSEYLVDSDGAASAGLGITALTALVVTGPVVSAGSRSARSYTVRGCRGCRIPAWILYGLSVLGGLITVAAPLATGEDPPYGLITADTVMGTVAGLLFSIDAFVAYSQARRQVRQNERTSEVGPPNEPELAETPDRDGRTARRAIPFFAPVTSPAGGTGGVLGLTLDI